MAASVSHGFCGHEIFAGKLGVHLRSWISVSDGHLDCLDVEFLCEIERALECLLRFPLQANDKVPVNPDSYLFAVLRNLPGLFDRGTLFDVLEDLRIPRFKADNE